MCPPMAEELNYVYSGTGYYNFSVPLAIPRRVLLAAVATISDVHTSFW